MESAGKVVLRAERRPKGRQVSTYYWLRQHMPSNCHSESRIGTLLKAACKSNSAMRAPLSNFPRWAMASSMVE